MALDLNKEPIDLTSRKTVLLARQAIDAYRQAHLELHRATPWHKDIPAEHTPLLEKLVDELERIGYTGSGNDIWGRVPGVLKQAFDCSRELNVKDLGFTDSVDFGARATMADEQALEELWH